ncbi:hypothetical protein PR202_gb20997 [Eleusine coracana subsp. coracana]|uniref:Uncharacterized protein n=1 Tax=Eleusine coracana subsp. coracana TaxID=191504 RepID=A0AAV5FCV1_ELECO|nr:hypothetical protein PR202_gb20997 [Eleusine coracana subsp. coracana]
MKQTTSLFRSVSASFTSPTSTTSAPPRASSASISVPKEPTQAAAAASSSLDIEHSHIDDDAPANCSTKCLSRALDGMVLAEVCDGVKEVVLIFASAAIMPTTTTVESTNTNLDATSTCSTKWLNGTIDIGTRTPATVDADTKESSLISVRAAATTSRITNLHSTTNLGGDKDTTTGSTSVQIPSSTSTVSIEPVLNVVMAAAMPLAIDVVLGDNGKEVPTTCLMEVLNLPMDGATPVLVYTIIEKRIIDTGYVASLSTKCMFKDNKLGTPPHDCSNSQCHMWQLNSGEPAIVTPAPWPSFNKCGGHLRNRELVWLWKPPWSYQPWQSIKYVPASALGKPLEGS